MQSLLHNWICRLSNDPLIYLELLTFRPFKSNLENNRNDSDSQAECVELRKELISKEKDTEVSH